MMRARVLGLACGAIFAASVAAMTGCGSAGSSASGVTTAETIRSANVALSVQDGSGNQLATGSGILISPKLVLTSAHLVAGQTSWKITTSDGKTATGVRGMTYDWLVYNSTKSHPALNDVAVIYLDKAIDLAAYPKVAASATEASATRIHGAGTTFTDIPSALEMIPSFPHAYVTDLGNGEVLDTGGAVLNGNNDIVGVVSGRGLTTGKLYIARTDSVSTWVTDASDSCDADGPPPTASSPPPVTSSTSSSSSTSGDITVKDYDTPPTSSSSSSGTTSSSSSSGTPTTTSSSTSTGGPPATSSSSSGGPPSTCVPNTLTGGGICYGSACPGDNSSSSSSGSPQSTSSSSSGSSSSSSGTPTTPTAPTNPTTTSSSTSSSSSTGGTPPAPENGCQGASCGGGSPDDQIDYGDYGACAGCGGDLNVK